MVQVSHLGVRGETCAGAEREQLGRFDVRQTVPEQHHTGLRVAEPDLADLSVIAQGADIKNHYPRAIHTEHALKPRGREVPRDDRDARVRLESCLQTQREQIIEAGDRDRDGEDGRMMKMTPTRASTKLYRHIRRPG